MLLAAGLGAGSAVMVAALVAGKRVDLRVEMVVMESLSCNLRWRLIGVCLQLGVFIQIGMHTRVRACSCVFFFWITLHQKVSGS